MTLRCRRSELIEALRPLAENALVFVADTDVDQSWESVLAELTEAFQCTRQAVAAGEPVVFVVDNDDLLGRNSPERAMMATALLSGARSVALEQVKVGIPVNVVSIEPGVEGEDLVRWCRGLIEMRGPTGELIHLGAGHLGKARP